MTRKMMELPETAFEDLLVSRQYLIVCYRSGKPCSYQIYYGDDIGKSREYFRDGQDAQGNELVYKFFLMPATVR